MRFDYLFTKKPIILIIMINTTAKITTDCGVILIPPIFKFGEIPNIPAEDCGVEIAILSVLIILF